MAPPAPSGAASKNPYSKHLEVAGLRITEDANKRLKVKYVVVNHSRADLPDLELIVALRSPGKEGTAPVCIFKAKVPGLGPFESKDLSANVPTNLRVYELPDWQFLRADFEVISPK